MHVLRKPADIFSANRVTAWMREYFWDRSEAVKYALAAAGVGLEEYDD